MELNQTAVMKAQLLLVLFEFFSVGHFSDSVVPMLLSQAMLVTSSLCAYCEEVTSPSPSLTLTRPSHP